ncbi:MAG: hypothetical protein JSR82_19350 [Verrucomicrobia bacterium]|nr:hypothetical protein [Verrucomicrobiota bacterium]
MAGYKATQTITLWKQHQCVACASHYRYLFTRSLTGQGGTAEKAQEALTQTIQKALESDVDFQPCPNCGTYQPDMTAQRERSRLFWHFLLTPIVGTILIIMGAAGGVRPDTMVWVTTAFAALMAAWLYLLESRNPNADLRANQNTAQKAINAGKLVLDQAQAGYEPGRTNHGGISPTVLGALALAVIVMPAAKLIRGLGGWPLNPTLHFPVIGPGDTSRLEMESGFQSVKGIWTGDASVQVANPKDLPPGDSRFAASTNKGSWGGTIRVKSSEKNSSRTPYVDITAPNNPALAGKTIELKTKVVATYPKMLGSGYTDSRSTFERAVTVKLAPPGAGATYKTIWGTTLSVGILIITVVGILTWRAVGARSRNTQTRLIPTEQPAASAPPPNLPPAPPAQA